MQRRDFLQCAAAGVLLGLVPWHSWAQRQNAPALPRLLILIELKGGNDGLNTVVPYHDPLYYQLRPRLAIAADQVLPLDPYSGLHPALVALMPLWQANELAIIQGVGYPKPNLSHFRSIEIWDTASNSTQYLAEGWLSRLFQQHPTPTSYSADGVILGSPTLGPLSGGARAIALNNSQQFAHMSQLADDRLAGSSNAALAHILKVESDIQHASLSLEHPGTLHTSFPTSAFGSALATLAQVLAGGAQVAVARISLNGFDTHRDQLKTQARLLADFAHSMAALRTELIAQRRWQDTVVMSYAEFGRRAHENQSGGTDHGTANAHFVLGGQVRGGFYGERPQLDRLDNGNLISAVDFRQLYATAIERWWGYPSSDILGGCYEPLDLLKG